MVGLAFKLSAVPFHFWCPDVFEGASAEVDAFLSVASKGAAMALLVRVALGVTSAGETASAGEVALADARPTAGVLLAPRVLAQRVIADGTSIAPVAFAQATLAEPVAPDGPNSATSDRLAPVRTFIVRLLAIVAAVTCTFGNLAAYGQTNIKRLLAYSTIAHAGYMIMSVAAAVQLIGTSAAGAREAVAALMFYLVVYVFMNLGAFAIVAFLRNALHSEEITDYAGLVRSAPVTSVALTVILVSLIGLPPLAGFVGKFAIFAALVEGGGFWMIGLLVIAGINTAVSLVYYLRVAKTVCIDAPLESRQPAAISPLRAAYVLVISLPVLVFGVFPAPILEIAREASKQLLM
jgi:NADH-quinone oxidoreductase subunit N